VGFEPKILGFVKRSSAHLLCAGKSEAARGASYRQLGAFGLVFVKLGGVDKGCRASGALPFPGIRGGLESIQEKKTVSAAIYGRNLKVYLHET
jgi:hypothetical protein